jgi:YebC/PmpR family DNA-binding regulatory protein
VYDAARQKSCSPAELARHEILHISKFAALRVKLLDLLRFDFSGKRVAMGRDFQNRKNAILKTAGIKSKLYSRYGKQLYVAAKGGVPDPESNPALRSLIEKAKKDQVPAHVIEKAIEKAKGAGGEDFSAVRYEGFGPGGCTVIVDCLTDNNTRTISEIRNCFSKTGSRLGATGSVALFFDQLAILSFKGENGDEVLEALLTAEVDVEEVESKDGYVTIYAPPAEFYKAKTALLQSFPAIELETQEITFLPQNMKEIGPDDLPMFEKFMGMLNDCDDVQNIYHNAIVPE